MTILKQQNQETTAMAEDSMLNQVPDGILMSLQTDQD